ncbi:MAG: C39 family peptidase [Bdellovibrionales bacterium]|nr:C39 family peptidase [Bdellovibrionales bacterium]
MKLLALLPLFLIIACEDTPTRNTIMDAAVQEPTDVSAPANPGKVPPATTATKLHSRCQSETRCFFARMPLYQQDSVGLANYIGNKIGVTGYQDPGLCSPTAATMVLRAVLDEKDSRTRLNNTFLERIPSRSWYETLFQIGTDAATDFYHGGTYADGIFRSYENYFRYTVPHKNLILTARNSSSYLTNANIIEVIKTVKPAFYLSVDAYAKTDGYVNGTNKTWHEKSGQGHALVIKGFDGDRLHIQDPWGMDYFSRLKQENFATTAQGTVKSNSIFTSYSYDYGSFMGRYGRDKKIMLEHVIVLGLD